MSFRYYNITPRILRVGQPAEITVFPRYEQRSVKALLAEGAPSFQMIANSGLLLNGNAPGWNEYNPIEATFDAENNRMVIPFTPDAEGEYSFRLVNSKNGNIQEILVFGVYALKEDLFSLRPFRGDMHIHTSYSECGARDENPRFVAAWACKAGLDFAAITDHAQRDPSIIAQDFINRFNSDFKVFNGEECHLLGEKQPTLVCRNRFLAANHIVSVGSSQGVVKFMNDHFDQYKADVQAAADKLPDKFSEHARFAMAGSDWIFDKIHEFGGLAIFAHPFWRACNRLNLPEEVREYILKQNKFDCMEVTGLGENNKCVEGNEICLAWWQQASIQRGKLIPIVANTDSHNTCVELNRRATIVFAKDNSFEAIAEAIRNGRSIAGDFFAKPLLTGDVRLVRYGYFLLREFYPEHDDMSQTLGQLMMDCLQNNTTPEDVAPVVKGRLTKLFNKYWNA